VRVWLMMVGGIKWTPSVKRHTSRNKQSFSIKK